MQGQGVNNTFTVVIVYGATGGIFVYSPTPGTGNLIAVIAGTGGTDPYGNNYGPGITSQNEATGAAALMQSGTIGLFEGVNVITEMSSSGFFFYQPFGGPNNLLGSITSAGGTDIYGNVYLAGFTNYFFGGLNWVALQTFEGNLVSWTTPGASQTGWTTHGGSLQLGATSILSSANGFINLGTTTVISGAPVSILDPITATSGTPGSPTKITTDSWNSLGTLAAGSGYTVNAGRYMLNIDGSYLVDVALLAGAATVAGTYAFATSLPAGPLTVRSYPLGYTGALLAAGSNFPSLRITTGGVVQVSVPALPNNTTLAATQVVPVN